VDNADGDYGPATCPNCGNEALDIDDEAVPELDAMPDDWTDEGHNYACLSCKLMFWADAAFGDEPLGWDYEGTEYTATQSGDDSDIFITRSPYYTRGPFCSPCAPGAVYLPDAKGEGARAYCFGPDWFDEDNPCPYPVYRVSDDACIYTPASGGAQ
jgi:hypothetical protein